MIIGIIYSVVIFSVYISLMLKVFYHHRKTPNLHKEYNRNPKVTIVVPAYDEQVTVIDSVKSMLKQDYNNFDICIVNDGSKDKTLSILIDYFKLKKSKPLEDKINKRIEEHPEIHVTPIEGVYTDGGRITVIDKQNGGKSTALNVGILFSDSEFTLNVDADTLLVKDAITETLLKKRSHVDAVACMVGVINGNKIEDGVVLEHTIPKKILPRLQWIEYIRSFIMWGVSNNVHDVSMIMSGAFIFINRNKVIEIGGYKSDTLAEDMELTMNLLSHKGKIQFLAETLAWTEVPEDLTSLTKQRLRWYRGGLQSIKKHKNLFFNRKHHGVIGFFMVPFIWFSEVIGPWVEVAGWLQIGTCAIVGIPIDWNLFMWMWIIITALHYIYMLLVIAFIHKRLNPNKWNLKLYRLFPIMLFETFTHHFLNLYWVLHSHLNEYRNVKYTWNKFERKGFD